MKRVALITGVLGGIGRATAELFVSKGWNVVGADRNARTEDGVKGIDLLSLDVSKPVDMTALKHHVETEYGRLDSLINNAAIQVCKPLVETSLEEWDNVMDSNLRSVFLGMQLFHPLLKTAHGAVVNVSSVHARQTSRDISAYAASKGAVMALTRAAALEFAVDGIRVNAILPGATDTGMLRAGLGRGHVAQNSSLTERMKQLADRHPLGCIGKPSDMAAAIYFLADSEQSAFITGEGLTVDGGALARLSTE
ncbi:MAG: short-chain dehydrogenase [Lentisphaerae bacterium GWF2_57_35]|nr:MAG: short-chain dehydrogenase [Lentisphaerae bacterium GWF2_57_35]